MAKGTVYSSDSRKLGGMKKLSQYTLYVRKSDSGALQTRMDWERDSVPDGVPRSIINADGYATIINRLTGKVELRTPAETGTPGSEFSQDQKWTLSPRINLEGLRADLKRLSFDIRDDAVSHKMIITVPQTYLAQMRMADGAEVRGQRLLFDTELEAFAGTEITMVQADGTEIRATQTPLYRETDGELIKIADVMVSEISLPDPEPLPPGMTLEDESSMEVVTEAELRSMEAEGDIVLDREPPGPDAGAATYTQTVVNLYDEIQLNTLTAADFLIPEEEMK